MVRWGERYERPPQTGRIDFYLGFGARIREARLARDFTEGEAAEAIGITVKRLRRLESGQPFRGNHRALWTFAMQFGIDLEWLLLRHRSLSTTVPSEADTYRWR